MDTRGHHEDVDAGQWRRVRRYLNRHRHELTLAAEGLYQHLDRVGPTPLLRPAGWIPPEPVSLDDVTLLWEPEVPPPRVEGTEPQAQALLPRADGGQGRFRDYADALAALDPPELLDNRTCYRLTDVTFGERSLTLAFSAGTYFAGLDVGEAVAHEFAAWRMRRASETAPPGAETESHGVAEPVKPRLTDLPLRDLVGNPADLAGRAVNPAISMLTLRRDRHAAMSFLLHHRDPARVAHGGGLYQVIPVGVFQPSSDSPGALREDFDLWRCVSREYGEELLGLGESYGEGVFPYGEWPLYKALSAARSEGSLVSYILGIGADPLSLATDILAVTVIEGEVFGDLFGGMVTANAEGRVVGRQTGGFPFTQDSVLRFINRKPMQAAGAATLWLAWQHHGLLASATRGRA